MSWGEAITVRMGRRQPRTLPKLNSDYKLAPVGNHTLLMGREGTRIGYEMSIVPRNGAMQAGDPFVGVLIVEDSWNVALSLKSIVEEAGARAIGPVPTVREALRAVQSQPIRWSTC
jgi:hypothetical protein